MSKGSDSTTLPNVFFFSIFSVNYFYVWNFIIHHFKKRKIINK